MADHDFHRHTRQRQVILEELCKLRSHPTAADLYEIVRRRLPNVSLGTVYRNLDLLARVGTIQRLALAGGEARFDGNPARHDHLRCVHCGKVDDVGGGPIDLPAAEGHDFAGYQVLGHRLEFLGVCPRCREQAHDPHNQSTETE
jgi:Fur family transcriptional regulator, ferric uptake regulator